MEGQENLIAKAERAKATAAAEHGRTAEHVAAARNRMARIERGEDVTGGLGH